MEARVGTEAAAYSKKVLLHYGGGSIKASGLYDRVVASLEAAGVEWVELGGVKPNPRIGLVREGVITSYSIHYTKLYEFFNICGTVSNCLTRSEARSPVSAIASRNCNPAISPSPVVA